MDPLRTQLARLLDWEDAHVGLDAALRGLPPELRGVRPAHAQHSAWELLEHLRITQRDILDFCRDPHYRERAWPDDYWPPAEQTPSAQAWDACLVDFAADREALRGLALDPASDLFAPLPHGSGQTLLRELLLVADHTAYHVGQLVMVRRLLGAWPPP